MLLMIVGAMLGSTVASTLINRIFGKNNDNALAKKTRAEATDIVTQASNRALKMMEANMRVAQERIVVLERRVQRLEQQVGEYYRLHGPLENWNVEDSR